MKGTPREELLRRAFSHQETDGRRHASSAGVIAWSEIAPIIEGLVFAGRPIGDATAEVTQRYDLGPRGCYILSAIDRGITYPLDLASLIGIGRSLVTFELNRLTSAGLVTSTPDKKDRRRAELSLTDLGRLASAEVRSNLERIVRGNLVGYSVEEIRLFARMLADAGRSEARV